MGYPTAEQQYVWMDMEYVQDFFLTQVAPVAGRVFLNGLPAKQPDTTRFGPIRADFTSILCACHPNPRASHPTAADFAAKLNDTRFACLTFMRVAAIARNRAEIGLSRR